MLAEITTHLRCPVCHDSLAAATGALRCPAGHSFDVARQGYVNLLVGTAPAGVETTAMVTARTRLLGAGHFAPLANAVCDAVGRTRPARPGAGRLILDAGAGPGHYLAAILDREPADRGLALDVAKAAVRVAARAHPRIAAAVCDTWRGLPVVDGAADVVLDIFAPRNAQEFHRVLHPDGTLLVVTPRPDHLGELVAALDLVQVDPDKDRRLDESLSSAFREVDRRQLRWTMNLDPADAQALVRMGPSAWHTEAVSLARRLAAQPTPLAVSAAVELRLLRPRA